MPHGPYFTMSDVGTFVPTPNVNLPPSTSMTAVPPGSLTLAPREWIQTNGGAANAADGTQFNNYESKTSITVESSTAGYANGSSYTNAFHATPVSGAI